ncbi:MAG: hypothetical protein ACK2UF_18760, partial [Candidatus Promineifilaceae bacterium]|jgi:hypothetical protein
MSEEEILKIEIPIEEEPPLKVETPKSGAKTAVSDTGRKIAGLAKDAAQHAAQSDVGRKAAGKVQEVTDRGVRAVGTRMADTAEDQARQTVEAMQKRLKETDWEREGKEGLASGLQWLSGRLKDWSDRVTPDKEQD